MANEPYDPYIPSGSKAGEQGPSNPKTAAIQQQIDDTVSALPRPSFPMSLYVLGFVLALNSSGQVQVLTIGWNHARQYQ